jgi:omega-6 fatty acid desaturase (delta-12 desaturase)
MSTIPHPVDARSPSPADAPPGVKEVRAAMGDDARAKSTPKALALLAVSFVPYILGFAGFFALDGWLMKALSAAVMTLSLPMLFVIGHDACHQSLTAHRWLNKLIGRLTMIPTWHAYSVWEFAHNGMHHAWTNVRSKDIIWRPFSTDEWAKLSPLGRFMHRQYRTWWGTGFYYMIEVWGKYGMTVARAQSPRTRALYAADWFSVFAYTVALVSSVVFLTDRTGLGTNWLLVTAGLLTLGVVVPFIIWNWVMGTIILVHHTHPQIPWYGDVPDWSFYAGQVQSTVHVELPRPIELVLHHIMEHTAHHADPRVPLYNLEKAQKHLEETYGEIVVVPFTFGGFFNTLRTCRLFDYENHRWLDWDGTPTTESLLARRDDGQAVPLCAAAA